MLEVPGDPALAANTDLFGFIRSSCDLFGDFRLNFLPAEMSLIS